MRFFDRDFVSGRLDDLEWERRQVAYERHRLELWPNLPVSVRSTMESIPFHDAKIELLDLSAPSRVVLRLYCDTALATSRITLEFIGAQISSSEERDMQTLVEDEVSVLIESEIDLAGENQYELRLIFMPAGELAIRFNDLRFQEESVSGLESARRTPVFRSGSAHGEAPRSGRA